MADQPGDALSRRRMVVVVLRLTVEDDGRLDLGEVWEVNGVTRQRVRDWSELETALRAIVVAPPRPASAPQED